MLAFSFDYSFLFLFSYCFERVQYWKWTLLSIILVFNIAINRPWHDMTNIVFHNWIITYIAGKQIIEISGNYSQSTHIDLGSIRPKVVFFLDCFFGVILFRGLDGGVFCVLVEWSLWVVFLGAVFVGQNSWNGFE